MTTPLYRATADGIVAESILSIAFALQLVVAVILLFLAVVFGALATGAASSGVSGLSGVGTAFEVLWLALGAITAVLLAVAYFLSYAPARRGDYVRARTATLVLGIVFVVLLVTAVIGVLYILAYGRLSDAVAGASALGAVPSEPAPAARPPGRYDRMVWVRCTNCGLPVEWPARVCPRCAANLRATYPDRDA